MPDNIQRTLAIFGHLLALAGVVFIAYRLSFYFSDLDSSAFTPTTGLYLLLLGLLYANINVALAFAWRNILSFVGESVTVRQSIRLFGVSQLAKYVPGNIMHLASRQAMGIAAGIDGWALSKSVILEFVTLSISGGLFIVFVLPLIYPSLTGIMALFLFIGLLSMLVFTVMHLFGAKLVKAIAWHSFFLMVAGLIFYILVCSGTTTSEFSLSRMMIIASAFVVGWLVGFLTPGAPAGVGVREVVTVSLLSAILAEGDLLIAVLLARVVTIIGDLIFYSFSVQLKSG